MGLHEVTAINMQRTKQHAAMRQHASAPNPHDQPFLSFWLGGFEGADHINGLGIPLNPNERNGHADRLHEDYSALQPFGIRTVRESVGWRLLDQSGAAGLRALGNQARIAASHGVQVIWTLMHYGWPDRLDPFERPEEFIDTFAAHCRTVARVLHEVAGPAAVYQPVNEISFLAWAVTHTGLIWPYTPADPERSSVLKRLLVLAALRGTDAVWEIAPHARILHTDPVVHVEAPLGAGPALCAAAALEHAGQFEAWDMLCGLAAPELGGAPRYLDLVGLNYYHNNQWEHGSYARLHWHLNDTRRRRPSDLIAQMWNRYQRPLCLSETGHVGIGRGDWFDHVAAESAACKARGIPLVGVCLYPLIDRPDWQDSHHWHHSGLWDVPNADVGDYQRHLCTPYAERLKHWQQRLEQRPCADLPFSPLQPESPMNTIIAFSHLRWDFVYQRPQQLLSRLAAQHPVLFVEEPMPGADRPWLEHYSPCAGVTVVRMHVQGTAQGFDAQHMDTMRTLLADHLQERGIDDYLLWFYTPMAIPLAKDLMPRGSIYDCMDELAAFDFAPKELLAREEELFKSVDLVFAGGRSLYESKRGRHAEVHCFPSSVDHAHFGQTGVADHPDQAGLAQPRLGYYGVIDERLDIALIAAAADAHPEWQWVMVGPVVKIDAAKLPQRPNLHWMGQRRYDELPAFLAGWNVCLMPFALNASTRFISPTKTLEYLAAGKPVVSTDIHDVRQHYAGVVPIAESHGDFIAACEKILGWNAEERSVFEAKATDKVAATSWDLTATAMQLLLERFDTSDELEPLHTMQANTADTAEAAASAT